MFLHICASLWLKCVILCFCLYVFLYGEMCYALASICFSMVEICYGFAYMYFYMVEMCFALFLCTSLWLKYAIILPLCISLWLKYTMFLSLCASLYSWSKTITHFKHRVAHIIHKVALEVANEFVSLNFGLK